MAFKLIIPVKKAHSTQADTINPKLIIQVKLSILDA